MTARTTSPFLTCALGCATLTVPMMTSPTEPYLRWLPPSTRMQRSSRAPLLSATLRTVSCWITSLRLLDDRGPPPLLLLGDGPGLGDPDLVAHGAQALFVVDLEAAPQGHDLLVQRVRLALLDQHDDGLLHAVADDDAVADLAPTALFDRLLTHHSSPSSGPASSGLPSPSSARGSAPSAAASSASLSSTAGTSASTASTAGASAWISSTASGVARKARRRRGFATGSTTSSG